MDRPRTAQQINGLVTCEISGKVRRALRARGVNAWSCDLQPCRDGSPYHITGDARAVIRGGVPGTGRQQHTRQRWHLLIAHPPCTYLCNSGVSRLTGAPPPNPGPGKLYGPARWQAMRDAAQLFVDLLSADVPYIALENPIMHRHARATIQQLPPLYDPSWDQTIQPYQFGDDASKLTGLWLHNLPELQPLPKEQWIAPRMVDGKPRWANQTDSGQNALTPSANRAELRSNTYPGIATAMAEQWIAHILTGGK